MNLIWLSAFRKVADCGSYTKAAELMYVSQPAISQQIQHLEQFFAAPLIQRTGREIYLTEAGKKVYELACLMEGEVESTRRSVQGLAEGNPLVTVVSAPSALLHVLPEILNRFWTVHPEVEVKTLVRFGSEITSTVKAGVADLGIHSVLYSDPHLKAVALRSRQIVCVCSPNHPVAKMNHVTPEDVSRQRVVVTGSATSTRKLVDDWFAKYDVVLQNVLEVSSHEEIRIAALQNLAIGFVGLTSVSGDLNSAALLKVALENFHPVDTTYISHRPNLAIHAAWLLDSLLN